VFRSARRGACDERALVLVAVGISCEVEFDEGYVVLVEASEREQALQQLWLYEQEKSNRPRPVAGTMPRRGGWRGSLVYIAILLLAPWAIAQGWFARDLYDIGVMDPRRIHAGEWWRAFTAMTLHWDATHLFGNLAGGALLGISAAQVWGSARAWMLITAAGALANLAEGLIDIGDYVSAGASTAVFAALGLVAAHAWRSRATQMRELRDWAPLVAGIALLGMFGAGAQDPEAPITDPTNVLSHALGFTIGAMFGLLAATRRGTQWLEAFPPWIAATVTSATVLVAWVLALCE
jgi:membrane associated rhomboid family serine protease